MQRGIKIKQNQVNLYDTTVFKLDGNVVTLNNGGCVTASTRKAMMKAFDIYGICGRITIRKGMMYMISGDNLVPFENNELIFITTRQ